MKKIVGVVGILFFIVISSCGEVINEENISYSIVRLAAPSNNGVLATKEKVGFHWDLVYGAHSYRLQVATPAFSNATHIVVDTILTDTVASPNYYTIDSLLAKSYEWRVKAQNSVYETDYTTNAFTVVAP